MYIEAIKQIRGLEYSNVKTNWKPNLIWKIKGKGFDFIKIRNQRASQQFLQKKKRASQHKVKFDDTILIKKKIFDDAIDNVSDYVARMK